MSTFKIAKWKGTILNLLTRSSQLIYILILYLILFIALIFKSILQITYHPILICLYYNLEFTSLG